MRLPRLFSLAPWPDRNAMSMGVPIVRPLTSGSYNSPTLLNPSRRLRNRVGVDHGPMVDPWTARVRHQYRVLLCTAGETVHDVRSPVPSATFCALARTDPKSAADASSNSYVRDPAWEDVALATTNVGCSVSVCASSVGPTCAGADITAEPGDGDGCGVGVGVVGPSAPSPQATVMNAAKVTIINTFRMLAATDKRRSCRVRLSMAAIARRLRHPRPNRH